MASLERLRVPFPDGDLSAAVHLPARLPGALALVLGHGAGSDLTHPFLVAFSEALCLRGHAVMRFNFPYKERGGRAPDPPVRLEKAFRAAVARMRERLDEAGDAGPQDAPGSGVGAARRSEGRMVLGGRSMGGRFASIVASKGLACDGLLFLGYPLHPAGKPEQLRDAHLPAVAQPMLFVQGSRDALCDLELLRPVLRRVGERASLHVVEGGDHSFDVLKSSGRTRASVLDEVVEVAARWLEPLVARPPGPLAPPP